MKDIWVFRFLILLGFASFDSLTTWASISRLAEEGNLFARAFMQTLGIPLGLTLFYSLIAGFLLLILGLCKLMFTGRTGPAASAAVFILDVFLAWFVAGAHFVGGTSWFWSTPNLFCNFLGAGIYLSLVNSIGRRFFREPSSNSLLSNLQTDLSK